MKALGNEGVLLKQNSGIFGANSGDISCTYIYLSHQPAHLPRYVRINSIKANDAEVINKLCADGFVFVSKQSDVNSKTTFCCDKDIPHVLMFHHSSSELLLHHPLYASSHIVLQDKVEIVPLIDPIHVLIHY